MHGVVSVLEEPHFSQVSPKLADLKRKFGVGSPQATAVPHFSYHVAPEYDIEKLKAVLVETAVTTPPFTVKTTGIGIFPGKLPVLYIPVARTPELQTLHTALWSRLRAVTRAPLDYYSPPNWFPHITLGHSDITPENLGVIVIWLNRQSLAWDVQVTNLTLLHDNGKQHVPLHRAALQG
ncbi:2'-5' RNA ligase family protein [Candidatus Leptofilum sp.]|uniref:2'-5' RNA ligase family protein n=1 Tax=Candidatus Leptofilum sp. TaxID=3241576 RepID=UPI003B5B60C7